MADFFYIGYNPSSWFTHIRQAEDGMGKLQLWGTLLLLA